MMINNITFHFFRIEKSGMECIVLLLLKTPLFLLSTRLNQVNKKRIK